MHVKPNARAAAATAFVAAAVLVLVYQITLHAPSIEIFLGTSMLEYGVMVFVLVNVLALVGIISFWLIRAKIRRQWLHIASWTLAFLFLVGVPAIVFLRHAASFRGGHRAMKALIVGLPPVLLLLAGALILKGLRIVSFFLGLFFAAVAAYHLVLLTEMIISLDWTYNPYGYADLIIAAAIVALAFWAVWLNWKFCRKRLSVEPEEKRGRHSHRHHHHRQPLH